MMSRPITITDPADARSIARTFPSFHDFVDDAMFHPAWGYYSTGKVRFGEGGHYDTFPLALSPLFGRMLAQYAYRSWRRGGSPNVFEICELGAGNGQLCLDVVIWALEQARHARGWKRFAAALRYRIVERSPALIARQRELLGPLAEKVTWTRGDLSHRPASGAPFAPCGLVFANEVLDCLAHHKVVPLADGAPGVIFVVPLLPQRGRTPKGNGRWVAGISELRGAVPRTRLAAVMCNERLRGGLSYREVALPVRMIPRLHTFLLRRFPEFFRSGTRFRPYFACPEIETLVRNAARLYRRSDQLWIDYGDTRAFHLIAPESQRLFAGPPHSGATVYRAPGRDDITFLVDFSVLADAAHDAGMRVKYYGAQGELARRSGIALDRSARDLILRYRMLGWMLAVVGVGPERQWRHAALTWNKRAGKGGRMRDDVTKAVAEFLGQRSSNFRLMILET